MISELIVRVDDLDVDGIHDSRMGMNFQTPEKVLHLLVHGEIHGFVIIFRVM